MEGEEDEDVIYEGSPLFEYLKETCPAEEFESSLPKSQGSQQVTAAGQSKSRYEYFKMVLSRLGSLHILQTCQRLVSWTNGPYQADSKWKAPFELRTLSRICKSKLLNEADKAFLKSLARYLEDETHILQPVPLAYIFISGLLFLTASICFLLPYVPILPPIEQAPVLLITAVWPEGLIGGVLLLWSFSIFLRGLHQWRISRLFRHLEVETDRCIHQEEMFLKCFRRSLQYIQEVEVLSRGYTMVNVPSGNKETSMLQLLPLRKVCLLVIARRLTMLRAATSALINSYHIPQEYRLSTDCITNQDIPGWIKETAINDKSLKNTGPLADCIRNQEIPQWMKDTSASHETPESNNDEEILSLSTLKILFGLYKEQCSDFYRQLVVSLVYSDQLSFAAKTGLQELQRWLQILSNSSSECKESTHRLTQTYQIHRWFPPPAISDNPREISRREVWRPEIQCVTAVHSLRLHLETILSRVSSVDDQLTDCEAVSITEERLTELQSLLADVGDHMDASRICCQEARASLNKMAYKEDPKEGIGGDNEEEAVAVKPLDQMERILITAEYSDDIDGDMDEQIFEAYIDAKRKLQEEEDSEEWLQERIQRRREAEDSKRMLQELNSVLTKRSKEKERNKQEKLRKQQAERPDSTPAAIEEISESTNTMPPTGHEYSSASLTGKDEPVQGTQGNKVGSGSHPEIRTESVNTAARLPPSSTANEATESSSLNDISCTSEIHSFKQTPDTMSPSWGQTEDTLGLIKQSGQRKGSQGERTISAGIYEYADLSKPCETHSVRIRPECELTYSGRNDSVNVICHEEAEFDIHLVKSTPESVEDTESSVVFTNEGSQPREQEEISEDESTKPHLYESDSSFERLNGLLASRDMSESRSSFLAVNPWMASGLAAQVAKISQERINLSEETFGENESYVND